MINEMEEVEICYSRNPKKPRLLCTKIINANALDIHLYKSEADMKQPLPTSSETVSNKIENKAQLLQYLNIVYKPQESDLERYENKVLSTADVLYHVWKNSKLFLNDNVENFSSWCSKNKVDFLESSRKRPMDSSYKRVSQRALYVLKENYQQSLIDDIINVKDRHKDYILDLKANNYIIIGYCRKSKTRSTEEEKIRCLNGMILGLKERSLVDEVYASVSCNASTPIMKRDLKENGLISKLSDVEGNAQDLVKRLEEKRSFCLVVVDSSGLTTNMDDLIDLMRNLPNLKKIIIENIINANEVLVLDCEDELIEPKCLFKFDGRRNLYHRSKNN